MGLIRIALHQMKWACNAHIRRYQYMLHTSSHGLNSSAHESSEISAPRARWRISPPLPPSVSQAALVQQNPACNFYHLKIAIFRQWVKHAIYYLLFITIPAVRLTCVACFRRFVSQFSNDFHEISQGLFSSHPPNTLKLSSKNIL